ncbi:MAG: signal peptidase II [Flavobacteriales bacterium]
MKRAALVISIVLIIDQAVKLWIKTHMMLGEEYRVFDWFIIHFTENNGMAFGLEWGGIWGKILLTLFRIVAVGGIFWYLKKVISQGAKPLYIISLALIFAGAVGNIIDSAFYGVLFNDSYGQLASFLPEEGGYAPLLQGKVVDMLYFPLIKGFLPEWLPWVGGDYFIFFRPIFNIADSAITLGVALILLFQRKELSSFK